MKKFKIYIDAFVFGGCFDDKFSCESKKKFEDIRNSKLFMKYIESHFTIVKCDIILQGN
ncbi:MAG: hypothetical protein ACUZ8O_08570 [Candidatus Anammoxibacter sp.]